MTNEIIKLKTEMTFIKTPCDREAPTVRAALVRVASAMAGPSEIISCQDVFDELALSFGLNYDEDAAPLLDMGPEEVKEFIGYSVDFDDEEAIQLAYQEEKEVLDSYYKSVASMSKVGTLENVKNL